VLDLARRHRCAPLLWLRASAQLRAHAPAALVARLRSDLLSDALRQHARLARLAALVAALEQSAVDVVVLKGLPLSYRLYGDAFARPTGDVDLLVPRSQRDLARAALLGRGARWVEGGRAPWEEAFELGAGAEFERVEVHSFLLGDLLAHVPPLTAQAERLDVHEFALPVLRLPTLAVALATHLSRHWAPPLLWVVDFHALWARLDAPAREEAASLAAASRVERYLEHARALATALDVAAGDDATAERARALALLGLGGTSGSGHPFWRDVRFARTRGDLTRVLARWAWPPDERTGTRHPLVALSARCARVLRRLIGGGQLATHGGGPRAGGG
jgi:hypothetical protein